MIISEILELCEQQRLEILNLWNKEYPERLMHSSLESFDGYLKKLEHKKHFLINSLDNRVIGWALVFKRENEKWFAMILDSEIQGKGYGTQLLKRIQRTEEKLFGWVIDHDKERKVNGEIYRSPIQFYMKNYFVKDPDQRLETSNISAIKVVWSSDFKFIKG